jgi:PD-(D/E)XK nuclease superfamily
MSGMARCRDCDRPIEWRQVNAKNVPFDPNTQREHWLTCPDPEAEHRRRRAGKVPGVFPISISRIGDYRLCPSLFARRTLLRICVACGHQFTLAPPPDKCPDCGGHLEKYQEPESEVAALGKGFHAYVAARLQGGPPPPPPAPVLTHAHEFLAMCEAFDAQMSKRAFDSEFVYGIEEKLNLQWQDEAVTVDMEGVMDYATVEDDFANITDFKTGWGIENPKELWTNLQSQTYCLMMWRKHPHLKRLRFSQLQFRYRGRTVTAHHPTEDRDWYEPHDLEVFEAALKAEVGRILRDTEFAPNPACTICPVGAHAIPSLDLFPQITLQFNNGFLKVPALRPPQDEEQAQKLALLAHVAGRLEWSAKNALKQWCSEHGPVWVAPDRALGHWEKISHQVSDVYTALEILQEQGFDLNRYVNLDMRELGPMLNPQSPRFQPFLAALIEDTTSTTFAFRKHEPEEKAQAVQQGLPQPRTARPELLMLPGSSAPSPPARPALAVLPSPPPAPGHCQKCGKELLDSHGLWCDDCALDFLRAEAAAAQQTEVLFPE